MLGGHTQVSRAVKNIVVTVTAIGEAYEQALTPSSAAAPGMDVIAVSYTHLDVYKRQVLFVICVLWHFRGLKPGLRFKSMFLAVNRP